MEIPDKHNVVFLIFLYLSIGMLLPWNFFINVSGYWNYKLRTVNVTSNSTDIGNNPLQLEFAADLAIAAMVPVVTMLVFNGLIGHKFRMFPRLIVSLLCIIVLFTLTLVMTKVNTDSWQHEFMVLTLVCVGMINAFNGVFQGGLFGLAGMFPSRYMDALLTGQGIGGVFSALINILMLSIADKQVEAAFACFLIAVSLLVGSALLLVYLSTTRLFKHYTNTGNSDDEKKYLLDEKPNAEKKDVDIIKVMKSIWEEEMTVLLIYIVTIACFPAICVLVQSTHYHTGSIWATKYFIPVACFLMFNIGDYLGRSLASFSWVPKPGSKFGLVLAVLRIVFIPLFIICNTAPSDRYYTSVLIPSDTVYIILVLLLSISNGFLTSTVMVAAPCRVHVHQQEAAANIMAGVLGVGLACGAFLSSALVKIL